MHATLCRTPFTAITWHRHQLPGSSRTNPIKMNSKINSPLFIYIFVWLRCPWNFWETIKSRIHRLNDWSLATSSTSRDTISWLSYSFYLNVVYCEKLKKCEAAVKHWFAAERTYLLAGAIFWKNSQSKDVLADMLHRTHNYKLTDC